MTIRQSLFNTFPCHFIGDIINQSGNLKLLGIGRRPLVIFPGKCDQDIRQSDQMKPDAGHPLDVIADGAARKGETANSRKYQQIPGRRRAARLLEKLLPPPYAVGYARALPFCSNCPMIEHVLHKHQGFCCCRDGYFRRHWRAKHIQDRPMLGDSVFVALLIGVRIDAIPANIE